MDLQSRWLIEGKRWFARSRLNVLEGMHTFHYQDAIMGVNHYIDNLIQRYGLDNLQILEYDYAYYRRLDPGKTWAVPGRLEPNKPLLISMPFAGFGTVHPQMRSEEAHV